MISEELAKLRAQKKLLISKLKQVQSHFRMSHEHDCLGWECAECSPQLMASEIEELIKPMEDYDESN